LCYETSSSELSTLSLHDALPISPCRINLRVTTNFPLCALAGSINAVPAQLLPCSSTNFQSICDLPALPLVSAATKVTGPRLCRRSEEHTSELQSRRHLVCRLLLE